MIRLNQILETALYVDDLDAARHFYGQVLGLNEHSHAENRNVFYQLESSMLLIFNPDETREQEIRIGDSLIPQHGAVGEGHMSFVIRHGEVKPLVDHLTGQGVEIESDVTWGNGAKSIYVRDPAGNSIEFATTDLWY